MRARKAKHRPPKDAPGYRGKQAKTGNSLGLRFDKALFQSHPEFLGDVRAHVIAPGRMLVVAESPARSEPAQDPVIAAFLAFLAKDMAAGPQQIRSLNNKLLKQGKALVGSAAVNPHEDLGEESLI